MNKTIENLTMAHHSAKFALQELISTMETASRLEAIVLHDLISDAAKLESRIYSLLLAIQE